MASTRTGRWRRLSAAAIALAFGALTTVAVAPPAAADDAPSLSVTQAPRAGGTVTVTGTGFNADPAANGIYLGSAPTATTVTRKQFG